MSYQKELTPSSRSFPCPICGRTVDGDCRISDQLVLCHHGQRRHPPKGLRPGDVIERNGQRWAFTRDTDDGRAAVYTLDKPRSQPTRVVASGSYTIKSRREPSPTPITGPAELARLPHPAAEPPEHLPDGQRLPYSPSQTVVVRVAADGKGHIPHHIDADGQEVCGAGRDPWPLFHEADALEHGTERWIAEAEGEKCASWLMAGGVVAVSQPGHAHKIDQIQPRYQRLQEGGVRGVVYLADHDPTGERKARQCAAAAAAAGLPLIVVRAADVWSGLPSGGSIDDARGTAAERLAELVAAIPAAAAADRHADPSPAEVKQRSWRELLNAMLEATVSGDEDEQMALRAETISRFRRTDAQIEAALFKLHTERQFIRRAVKSPESLDLSRISGMDWRIEGFVPDKDQTLVFGDAGSGKTTAALTMVNAVLQGIGLLDHTQPAPRGKVLFIASDSGASPLFAAMQDMGMADMPEVQQGPGQRLFVWASDPDQGMTAWSADLCGCIRVLDFVRRHQIDLVIIDSCKAVCSGAGLDYTNNQLVTSLLTYVKEVICPYTAVVWINHDGVAKGAHAGAKAWKEIPSMVHRIAKEEQKDGSVINSRRHWRVTKSRMGPCREFYYELNQGELKLCPHQEVAGNCLARVVDVLTGALQLEGKESLSKADLVERICRHGGPSKKTLENTLTTATRAKHPEVCRIGRGRYKLAPRIANALKGCMLKGKEDDETLVSDSDLPSSHQVPTGTSGGDANLPREVVGKSSDPRCDEQSVGIAPARHGHLILSPLSDSSMVLLTSAIGHERG